MEEVTKIALGLSKMSDSEVQDFGFSIANALNGNQDFPQPTNPTLVQLIADTEAYKNALAATASGEKVTFMVKNKKRKALEVTIKAMAVYVELSNDPVKITGAGFTLATAKSKRILGDANGFEVTIGSKPGTAIFKIGKVKNAISYFIEYAISPTQGDQRVHVPAPKGKVSVSKLKSLTAYDFIAGANGSGGQIVYTDAITKTVV